MEFNKNITSFVFWFLRPLAMDFGGPYVYALTRLTLQYNLTWLHSYRAWASTTLNLDLCPPFPLQLGGQGMEISCSLMVIILKS